MNLRTANRRQRRKTLRHTLIEWWQFGLNTKREYRKYRRRWPRNAYDLDTECRNCIREWPANLIEPDGLCPLCH